MARSGECITAPKINHMRTGTCWTRVGSSGISNRFCGIPALPSIWMRAIGMISSIQKGITGRSCWSMSTTEKHGDKDLGSLPLKRFRSVSNLARWLGLRCTILAARKFVHYSPPLPKNYFLPPIKDNFPPSKNYSSSIEPAPNKPSSRPRCTKASRVGLSFSKNLQTLL